MKRLLIVTLLIVVSACAKSSSPSPTTPTLASPSYLVMTATPDSPARNQAVTFTCKFSPQGSIASYMFDFGDGAVGSGGTFLENSQSDTVNVQHVYKAAGTFSVRLTGTKLTGETVSVSRQITVSEQ